MPSSQHEALHRIFRDNPGLFSHAFKILKIDFPASSEVAVIDTDLTEIKPIDRRCDTMMLFKTPWGSKQVVIIESQMQKDDGKVAAWAHYISYAHIKYECPVLLLVICQDETTARWARDPKRIGLPGRPCLVIYPIVLGPDNVPRITDPEEASKDVVLAMFSAVTHAHSPEVDAILEALDVALDTVDTDTANYIAEQTEIGLGAGPARQTWRRLMTMQNYRFKSEFAEMLRGEGRIEGRIEGEARGEARGEAKSVLRILKRRGIHVTESARERILSCTDLALLETWLDQSFEVTTAEQLFD